MGIGDDFYLGLFNQKENNPEKGITFSIDGNYMKGFFLTEEKMEKE